MQLPFRHQIEAVWRTLHRDVSWKRVLGAVILAGPVVCAVLAIYVLSQPPSTFPVHKPIVIEKGATAADVATAFQEEEVVRSGTFLYIVITLLHDPAEIKAGAYVFQKPHTVFSIASQITDVNPPTQNVSLTFFEGTTAAHYAHAANKYLPEFDVERFVNKGRSYEGFLFPDTYYVPYTFTADDLITLLFETYHDQVAPILARNRTDLNEYEVITVASLLEREGRSEEDMRMIAGIMFNRLEIGMALQLDASIEYVLEKPLNELTPADLRVDTPYNTYLNTGLPPTPIGNPGVAAVRAAVNPIKSDYLFYITGKDGKFYYAETYEEHLHNIEQYLR